MAFSFGQPPATTANTVRFSFGGTTTAATGASTGALFSAAPAPQASLFGSQQPAGSLFGGGASTTTSATNNAGFTFGGGTAGQSQVPAQSTTSLFGQSQGFVGQQGPPAGTFNFGAPIPSSSTTTVPSISGGLFGQGVPSQTTATTQGAGGGLFGAPTNTMFGGTTLPSAATTTTAAATANLFGTPQNPKTPVTSTIASTTSGLFGTPNMGTPSLFGTPRAAGPSLPAATTGVTGLFSTPTTAAFSVNPTTAGLTLFGQPTNQNPPAATSAGVGLFGQPSITGTAASTTTGSTSQAPSLFGVSAAATMPPASGGLFGQPGTTRPSFGLFGSGAPVAGTAATNVQTSGLSLFPAPNAMVSIAAPTMPGATVPSTMTAASSSFPSGLSSVSATSSGALAVGATGATSIAGVAGGLFGISTAPTNATGSVSGGLFSAPGGVSSAPTQPALTLGGGSLFTKPVAAASPFSQSSGFPVSTSATPTTVSALSSTVSAPPSIFGTPSIANAATTVATSTPPSVSLFGAPQPAPSAATSLSTGGASLAPQTASSTQIFGGVSDRISTATTTLSTSYTLGTPVVPSLASTTRPSLSLTIPTATSAGLTLPTLVPATAGAAPVIVPPAPLTQPLTYQQLEDQLNKWTTDLEEQERIFFNQVAQVNVWDRVLVENGDKIVQLSENLEQLNKDQGCVEQELDFVSHQQRELADILNQLEQQQSASQDDQTLRGYASHADIQRRQIMDLAVNVDAQIKQVGQDLSALVERVNEGAEAQTDPLHQISQILSRQMDTLQWIDGQIGTLERSVQEVTLDLVEKRKEVDKTVRYG